MGHLEISHDARGKYHPKKFFFPPGRANTSLATASGRKWLKWFAPGKHWATEQRWWILNWSLFSAASLEPPGSPWYLCHQSSNTLKGTHPYIIPSPGHAWVSLLSHTYLRNSSLPTLKKFRSIFFSGFSQQILSYILVKKKPQHRCCVPSVGEKWDMPIADRRKRGGCGPIAGQSMH